MKQIIGTVRKNWAIIITGLTFIAWVGEERYRLVANEIKDNTEHAVFFLYANTNMLNIVMIRTRIEDIIGRLDRMERKLDKVKIVSNEYKP